MDCTHRNKAGEIRDSKLSGNKREDRRKNTPGGRTRRHVYRETDGGGIENRAIRHYERHKET